MSRSGYDGCDNQWDFIRWRGAVNSAIRGARGQAALKDMADALDSMADKRLVTEELATDNGEYCALGVLGAVRGIDMAGIDPYEYAEVSKAFGIAQALVREIEYENDEGGPWLPHHQEETPENRWRRMRAWVAAQIRDDAAQ